jgi:hypothetical protein
MPEGVLWSLSELGANVSMQGSKVRSVNRAILNVLAVENTEPKDIGLVSPPKRHI